MKTVFLGGSDVSVSRLAFGANVLGWTLAEKDSFYLLDLLAEKGINFIDTADVYSNWVQGNSGGESEKILGKWFKQSGKRHNIVLATKAGLWNAYPGLSAAHIRRSIDASLQRLQTDYIDIYFAHRDDLNTDQEETMTAMSRLIDEGKVRVLGASNYSASRLLTSLKISASLGMARFEILQPKYNLYDRNEYETDLLAVASSHQLAVTPYYSLASGFLSGKYRTLNDISSRPRSHRLRDYMTPRGAAILAALKTISADLGVAPATISLAWLMGRASISAPIVSATSVAQLNEISAALHLELPDQARLMLDRASKPLPQEVPAHNTF